jgi:MYXO-CTERM domain-containing protein
MKQWLARRGLLVTIPAVVLAALAVDACSSNRETATGHEPETSTASAASTGVEHELVATELTRTHLARIAQFSRIVPADVGTAPQNGAQPRMAAGLRPSQLAATKKLAPSFETRAVVTPGEVDRFTRRGDRIHAQISAELRRNSIRPANIELPATADGFVRIQADGNPGGVEFAAVGAKTGVPIETADGLLNYPHAGPHGGDMVLSVGRQSIEDFIVLEEKPEHPYIDYRVKVGEVAGLRLNGDILEFLAENGDPQIHVGAPSLVDADGTSHRASFELPDCSVDRDAAAPWGRPVTAPGASECTVRVRWEDKGVVYPAIVDPVWSTPGALATARYKSAASRQAVSGFVIMCGGSDVNANALTSCELFNPAANGGAGAWASGPTLVGFAAPVPGDPRVGRQHFTMISIGNDTLAVGDGSVKNSERLTGTIWKTTTTDFSAGQFDLYGLQPVATNDGKYVVLIDQSGQAFYYEVAKDSWTAGATLSSSRYQYTTMPSPGGSVLRCGGYDNSNVTLKTCDRYTPGTAGSPGTWGAGPSMKGARYGADWAPIDATHLIVYGGYNQQAGQNLVSAETYTSTTDAWTTNTPTIPNGYSNGSLRNNFALHSASGKILTTYYYSPTIYDPATQNWTTVNTYDGTTSFSTFYSNEGTITSVGTKVLLAPVAGPPNNNATAPSTLCKLFDFVAQGGTCQQTSDCKTGLTCYYDNNSYTPDGLSVCCDTTCTDPCYSCRAVNKENAKDDGTCGPRLHDLYINSNSCAYASSTTCGNVGQVCDGKGACKKWDTSTVCVNGSCADGDTQNNQQNCDGKGACAAATATDCSNGYACQYGQCQTKCYDDSYCAASSYCQYWATPLATVNQCLPRKAAGNTCSNNSTTECSSGNCVDGFCCDKACNGLCEACSNAITGKTNGVCNPVPAGQASNKDCFDQGSGSCGQTGFCDGARACQKYGSSTQCADIGTCATETSRYIPDLCDGAGTCVDKGTQACSPGYACNAGVCQTQCTADTQCVSAYYCDVPNKICVLDKKQGQTCLRDQACEGNSNCVEIDALSKLGVCCNSGCAGDCQSCLKVNNGAADGTCGNVVDDLDPKNKCAQGAAYPNSCAAPGLCNGQGACRPYAKDTVECDTDSCADSTLTTYTCNGAGTCKAKATQCYPFKCDAANNTCRIACSVDTHCVVGSFCKNGTCVGQLVNGSACTDGAQCKSTHCANFHEGVLQADIPTGAGGDGAGGAANDPGADAPGVCCDSDCQGTCSGCKASIKGFGSDGVCEFVKNNTDPANDCEKAGGDLCGLDGQCNGAGACRLSPSGTSCGASSCQGNSVLGQSCNGQGDCINNQGGIDCAPYVCRDVEGAFQCTNPCATDNDCQDGYFCSDAKCSKKLANGKACDSSGICGSGYCVDGVCCDTSCNGQCEACDAPASEGTCTPVQGDPHGARAKCDHSGEECGGQCDGVNASSCKYSATGTTCGDVTCDSDLAKSSACDGQGSCKANKDTECSPYTCGDDNSCLSRCQQDLDCSQGYACDETTQRCLPSAVAATCSDDRLTSVGQNGQNTPCKPFLCVPASGTCAFSCAFTTDCAPDFVCEPSTKTCLPAPTGAGTADDQSCACRAAGAAPDRSGSGYWALAAFGIALTGLRRRKRSRNGSRSSTKPASFGLNSQPLE